MPVKKKSPPNSSTTTLHIKNMVCNRCIKVVGDELRRLGHDVRSVILGEAVIGGAIAASRYAEIKSMLEQNGFELIEDKRVRIVEKIKHAILKLVQNDYDNSPIKVTASQFIAREVGMDYPSLSSLFSSMEGTTIEHYTILERIERAKEFLKYGEWTLSEISYKLGYSSVAHLSAQFKQISGMTPSKFKKMLGDARQPVDKVYQK
jgi:AraC family transcriptional regulator